jgi:TnsA endonuclease N terminal
MKGMFKPKNPGKYLGNPTNIVYRSKWELDFMMYLDMNTEIVGWGSEELAIPYRSPVDGRVHRYFPDMVIKKRDGGCIMVEIKPYKQTQPPSPPKKPTKTSINEAVTYITNQAKWEAARAYCDARGWKFQVITEKELYRK